MNIGSTNVFCTGDNLSPQFAADQFADFFAICILKYPKIYGSYIILLKSLFNK